MKLELIILGVTIIFIANVYYDGQIFQKLRTGKKYYQIAFFAFAGLCIYLMLKRKPQHLYDLCKNANSYVKYMPIDRNTLNMVMPIIDFTKQQMNYDTPISSNGFTSPISSNERKILTSGGNGNNGNNGKTKRSVSETKKKYVAAEQNWKCKHCSRQLPAWFEVDHVVKLEYGGSNSIDNLEALCRDCHGKKTSMENL